MADRPFEDKRPVGPFVDNGTYLMVGFPVAMPTHRRAEGVTGNEDDPIELLEDDINRRFKVDKSDIRHDRVNLSGNSSDVVLFISFPYREEEDPTTASQIEHLRDQVEDIVEDVTNKNFAANVSIWAGGKRSGKNID